MAVRLCAAGGLGLGALTLVLQAVAGNPATRHGRVHTPNPPGAAATTVAGDAAVLVTVREAERLLHVGKVTIYR